MTSFNIKPTNCRNCIFQNIKQGQQIGCLFQDLDPDSYFLDHDSFQFKAKICQYKRNAGWHKDKNIKERLALVRQEVQIKYIIAIQCDSPYLIKQIIKEYGNAELPPQKIIFYVNEQVYAITLNDLKKLDFKNWTLAIHPNEDLINKEDCFRENKAQFFALLEDPDSYSLGLPYVPPKFFKWLDEQINDYGFRFRFIGGTNKIVSQIVYKNSTETLNSLERNISQFAPNSYYDFDTLYKHYKNNAKWCSKDHNFKLLEDSLQLS